MRQKGVKRKTFAFEKAFVWGAQATLNHQNSGLALRLEAGGCCLLPEA